MCKIYMYFINKTKRPLKIVFQYQSEHNYQRPVRLILLYTCLVLTDYYYITTMSTENNINPASYYRFNNSFNVFPSSFFQYTTPVNLPMWENVPLPYSWIQGMRVKVPLPMWENVPLKNIYNKEYHITIIFLIHYNFLNYYDILISYLVVKML